VFQLKLSSFFSPHATHASFCCTDLFVCFYFLSCTLCVFILNFLLSVVDVVSLVVVVVAFSFTHTHTDNNVHTRDDVSGTFNVCCCFWFFFRCFTNVAFTTKVKYELIARQKYLSDTMNETRNSAIHVAVDVAANRSSGRARERAKPREQNQQTRQTLFRFLRRIHIQLAACALLF